MPLVLMVQPMAQVAAVVAEFDQVLQVQEDYLIIADLMVVALMVNLEVLQIMLVVVQLDLPLM